MRDVGETPVGAPDRVDQLLEVAGARWRSGQPEPRPMEAPLFLNDRPPRIDVGAIGRGWSFVAGAASAAVVLIAVALAVPSLIPRFGGGAPATPDPATGYLPTGLANCPLTRPDGSFTPPPQPGADYDLSNGYEGLAWYGTAKLWTWLHNEGETWGWLPDSEAGRSYKTFWWRQGYEVRSEPTPQIFVKGKRLDGPGRFGFGPGTNAFWGLGSAMLVGIEVPEPGCWEITAHYYNERLSYVVWVEQGQT